MNRIYQLMKWGTRIRSRRLKMLGIWGMHCLGKRYIGIFLDPVLACNLRCKMCYFSDEKKRQTYKGMLKIEEMEQMAKALFHRALKLQIGCGAEPTLHKNLKEIVALGRKYGIPYISITTNGNLLDKDTLRQLIEAGLNELTLSAHGLTQQTYEELMPNGKFERFVQLLQDVEELKREFPAFKLRLNYTINRDNMDELRQFWEVVRCADIVQLRPIQHIGDSVYQNFSTEYIAQHYEEIIQPIRKECQKRGITYIIPEPENLKTLEKNEWEDNCVEQATYCTLSPRSCWKDDFDYHNETYESYARRTHYGRKLLGHVFGKTRKKQVNVTRKMNYKVK